MSWKQSFQWFTWHTQRIQMVNFQGSSQSHSHYLHNPPFSQIINVSLQSDPGVTGPGHQPIIWLQNDSFWRLQLQTQRYTWYEGLFLWKMQLGFEPLFIFMLSLFFLKGLSCVILMIILEWLDSPVPGDCFQRQKNLAWSFILVKLKSNRNKNDD